jgi:hypothetical protein
MLQTPPRSSASSDLLDGHHSRFEIALDQFQYPPIADLVPYLFHQLVLRNAVKVAFDICVDHPVVTFPQRALRLAAAPLGLLRPGALLVRRFTWRTEAGSSTPSRWLRTSRPGPPNFTIGTKDEITIGEVERYNFNCWLVNYA